MKQPSMFHKNDMARYYVGSSDDEQDNDDYSNPIGPVFDAIQKQRAKQRARLPKNNISDPVGVIIHNFIKLAGVHAIPAKIIISLLANKDKYDPKLLSNMSDLLNTNRFEPLAILYVAIKQYYMRYMTSRYKNKLSSQQLTLVFNNIANEILETATSVHIKSIAQEMHAMFSDPELDPLEADKVLKERFTVLKQQLQHQINNQYKFDIIAPCLVHNLTPPCKIKGCNRPHICRCGATDHIMSDKRCPMYHKNDDTFFDKINSMNNYHARRANKIKRWKKYDNTYNSSHNNSDKAQNK